MHIHTYTIKANPHEEVTNWYIGAFVSSNEIRKDITKWCYNTFGTPGFNNDTYQTRWKDGIHWGEVVFSQKQDLEWFILRWS